MSMIFIQFQAFIETRKLLQSRSCDSSTVGKQKSQELRLLERSRCDQHPHRNERHGHHHRRRRPNIAVNPLIVS